MSTKPYKSAPHATEMLTRDFLIGIQVGQNTGDAGKAQMKYMTIGELADWIQVNYGAIWKYRGEYSSALPTDVRQNDYFLATGTFTVGGVTYTVNHLYAYDGTSWGDISNVLTQYASQAQVTYIAGKLANVVRHDDSVPTGGVTVNADQLNGISDSGYVKKYTQSSADWDTVPTNGSTKPVTSDGVYDAINAITGNLVRTINGGAHASATENGTVVTIDGADADTYWRFNIAGGILKAGKYRMSFYCYGFDNDSQYYIYHLNDNAGYGELRVKNGINSFILNVPSDLTSDSQTFMDDYVRSPAHAHTIIGFSIVPIN